MQPSFPQFVDLLLCALYRVEEFHATAFIHVDETVHLWADAEDANLESLSVDDGVLLHCALDGCAGEVVVGAEYREFEFAEHACHILQSEVELMVADGSGIIVHLVHQSGLHIALEEGVVGAALGEVATVEEQQVGVLGALFLEHRYAAEESSASGFGGIGEVDGKGIDLAVGVVGVEDGELTRSSAVAEGAGEGNGDDGGEEDAEQRAPMGY